MLTPTEQGYWVDEHHARISELIKQYNPELELCWIPPDDRSREEEFPYAVKHNPKNAEPYIMFRIRKGELDHRVLAKIYDWDNAKHPDILGSIEAQERAQVAIRQKELEDAASDRKDFIRTLVASPKHSFKHNGKIIPK